MTYKKTASILTIFISLGLAGFSAAAGVINESKTVIPQLIPEFK